MSEPIRILIGCSANDEDLEFCSVLHYSLEKHATKPLDITWMKLSRDPKSFWFSDPQRGLGWNTKSWHTPFSALRWSIPAYFGYEGRAIYLDIDMIVMADIAELWDQPFKNGAAMISKTPAICVCMYDNARMKSVLPPIDDIKRQPGLYRQLRQRVLARPGLIQRYQGNWNCLDLKRDGGGEYSNLHDAEIRLLHFTKVPTQPHLRHAVPRLAKEGRKHWYTMNRQSERIHEHPRKDALKFFDETLAQAQAAGYTLDRYRNPEGLFGDYGR